MKDRFNLEDSITQCWSIVDDIRFLANTVIDDMDLISKNPEAADKIHNILVGMQELYNLKFEDLWETYKEVHRLDQYNNEANDK